MTFGVAAMLIDRHEVGQRVVADLGVDGRVGGRGRHRGHAQHVAVGRGLDHLERADRAAAAGLVLHQHLLAQFLAQAGRDDARDDVGGAARREGHDQADRLAREGLGQGQRGRQGRHGQGGLQQSQRHGRVLRWCPDRGCRRLWQSSGRLPSQGRRRERTARRQCGAFGAGHAACVGCRRPSARWPARAARAPPSAPPAPSAS